MTNLAYILLAARLLWVASYTYEILAGDDEPRESLEDWRK
jgi:hypothetical protein